MSDPKTVEVLSRYKADAKHVDFNVLWHKRDIDRFHLMISDYRKALKWAADQREATLAGLAGEGEQASPADASSYHGTDIERFLSTVHDISHCVLDVGQLVSELVQHTAVVTRL